MINFKKHSGIFTLTAKQKLNIPLDQAWNFFSTPENLERITPEEMQFNITSELCDKFFKGKIITYKVGILPGVKTNWVTEITHIEDKVYFIDEQRFGPYKMWHHEHWFEEISENTTLISDKVSYKIPFGFFGSIAQFLFIKNQLKTIFNYRYITLEKLFNGK